MKTTELFQRHLPLPCQVPVKLRLQDFQAGNYLWLSPLTAHFPLPFPFPDSWPHAGHREQETSPPRALGCGMQRSFSQVGSGLVLVLPQGQYPGRDFSPKTKIRTDLKCPHSFILFLTFTTKKCLLNFY